MNHDQRLFEFFAHKIGLSRYKDDNGEYLYAETRAAWRGWTGCLDSIEGLITSLDVQRFVIHGRSERFVRVNDLTSLLTRTKAGAGGGA